MIGNISDVDNRKILSFPQSERYPASQVLRVQDTLLQMLITVDSILSSYRIPYCLAFGSLMGAQKCSGFLPWDDDIDLFLFDEGYDEAIAILETKLPRHLVVHSEKNDPNYFLSWNSIRNTNTIAEPASIYHPHNNLLKYRCIGIDLYRLKRLQAKDTAEYHLLEEAALYERKYQKKIISKDEWRALIAGASIEKYVPYQEMVEEQESEVFTFVVKMRSPILVKDLLPLKRDTFGGVPVWVPQNTLACLNCMFPYVDEMPPFEQRLPHLKAVRFLNA